MKRNNRCRRERMTCLVNLLFKESGEVFIRLIVRKSEVSLTCILVSVTFLHVKVVIKWELGGSE